MKTDLREIYGAPTRHQTRLPQRGLQPFQNRIVLQYTLSASGLLSNQLKVAVANDFR
jgi:hypothetical protein